MRADFVPLEQAQPALRACWEVAKGWDGVVEGDEDAKPNWAHTAGYLEVGSVYNCKLPPSSWFQRIGISQPSHLVPADSHIRVFQKDVGKFDHVDKAWYYRLGQGRIVSHVIDAPF